MVENKKRDRILWNTKAKDFFSELICSNGKTVSTAIGFWNAGLKVEDHFRRDFSNLAPPEM
jgi:hypothetical protein